MGKTKRGLAAATTVARQGGAPQALAATIDEALALLASHAQHVVSARGQPSLSQPSPPLPNLLARCEAMIAAAAAQDDAPRIVLALDEGTAAAAAWLLGLLPNLHVIADDPDGAPDDPVAAAAAAAAVAARVAACRRRGLRAVRIVPLSARQIAALPPGGPWLVALRHPAAAWVAARETGATDPVPSFETFCNRLAALLDTLPGGDPDRRVLAIDLALADPAAALERAAAALDLTIPAALRDSAAFEAAMPDGQQDAAAVFPQDPDAALALLDEPSASPAHAMLCARLGHDPDRPPPGLPAGGLAGLSHRPTPTGGGRLSPAPGQAPALLGQTLAHLLRIATRPGRPFDVPALVARLDACLADMATAPEALDAAAARLPRREAAALLILAAAHRAGRGEALLALDLMADAEDMLPPDAGAQGLLPLGAGVYQTLGKPHMALALLARDALQGPLAIGGAEGAALGQAIRQLDRSAAQEHGHVLLMDWLAAHPPAPAPRLSVPRLPVPRLMVEIGTTRERVPGQGSTEKLALFCARQGIDFVTVDMDPRNAARAGRLFRRLGLPFRAVAARGEDWLAAFPGQLDYVFLDAYDFDHGKHSEQRQSRYEVFLGGRIDEAQCHQMHLDCARTLVDKLSPDGLICLDDTWTDAAGRWTAKGTTAMPYLLGAGFRLLEARNHAALLARA